METKNSRKHPSCHLPGSRFVAPATWRTVRHAAETNEALYYFAPLDLAPVRVTPKLVFKNGKIRFAAGATTFTANADHLERFFLVTPA